MKTYVFILAFFISFMTFSQKDDGTYLFINDEYKFSFTISDSGLKISSLLLKNKTTGEKIKADGYWYKLPEEEMSLDYIGPLGWYKFQTAKCNYTFNAHELGNYDVLFLRRHHCKDPSVKTNWEIKLDRAYN